MLSSRVLRVFLCEDDPAVREALAAAFESKGWEVALAATGDELLDHWAEFAPDAIVVDNTAPGVPGIEAVESLKGKVNIPVIFYSGYITEAMRERAERMGAKPITKGMLDELIDHLQAIESGVR